MASEVTQLPLEDEIKFQLWVKKNNIKDLDHPDSHYDYRGFWKANPTFSHAPGEHFPDTFKQHGHPSFSQESQYSSGPSDGGIWLPGESDVLLKQPPTAVGHRLDPLVEAMLKRLPIPGGK